MKKTIKFAILSVIFALCLCFAFLSNNFIGVYANESTEEILEEEITEKVYTYTHEEGVAYLTLKSDFTFEVKVVFTDSTKENIEGFGYYVFVDENNEIVILSVEGEHLRVQINNENMTFNEYVEIEEQKPETAEEIKQLEDWVVVIIGALMSLGVSWGSILTIIKWIKNRLNTNKNNINEVIVKLKENQEEIETLKEVLKKLITDDKQLYDLLSEIKQDFTEFNNSEKEKTKIINTEISKILKKEDEVNE